MAAPAPFLTLSPDPNNVRLKLHPVSFLGLFTLMVKLFLRINSAHLNVQQRI